MSAREKLIQEINVMSDEQAEAALEAIGKKLRPWEREDYSTEQLQRAYDELQKIVDKIEPFEYDLEKAKDEYFEEKYGRFN
jgi:hypothetical protein